MCLAVPMKLKSIRYPHAVGEAGGIEQDVRVDFVEGAAPGDYVIIHAGFAIQKLSEEEAMENIRVLEEIKDAL